jgi:hypothetical protein
MVGLGGGRIVKVSAFDVPEAVVTVTLTSPALATRLLVVNVVNSVAFT